MPRKDDARNPSLKAPELYETLRKEGYSKAKSAAISNAKANPDMHPSSKGGKVPAYEEWTVDELHARARELDVDGRSSMNKEQLINALRNG